MPIAESLAMAFGAATIGQVINRLMSLAENEIRHVLDTRETIGLLETAVQSVQTKLDRLSSNQHTMGFISQSWEPWVRDVTKLCYDIDDIIDNVKLSLMKKKHQKRNQPLSLLRWLTYLRRGHHYRPLPMVDDHELPLRITDQARNIIWSRLESWGLPRKIAHLVNRLDNIEHKLDILLTHHSNNIPNPHNRVYVNQQLALPHGLPLPPGRQRDNNKLIEKLLTNNVNTAGVCIVGMAGVGKTVLARAMVDHPRILNCFDIILWVPSLVQVNHDNKPFCLHGAKAAYEKGKAVLKLRSLIVVDDLGGLVYANLREWEIFTQRYVGPTTTLVITTRDPRTASCTHTIPYYLKRMSDEDCEELIRSKVNPAPVSDCDFRYFNLKASNIAKKCMGLPLLATSIGLVLNLQRCTRTTVDIFISEFEENEVWWWLGEQINRALRINHPILPLCLNKLLAYLTLFPHDHVVTKKGMLPLWISEGFIQPETWSDMDQANQRFDEMLPMSALEPHLNHPEELDPSTYQTNDISHWFARRFVSNMCLRIDTGELSTLLINRAANIRHLSLCSQHIEKTLLRNILRNCNGLRTFMLLHKDGTNIRKVPSSIFQKQILLRVLDLSHSCLESVPESIKYLKHLRYLDLSHTLIRELPNSICKLLGLRVLKLIDCNSLVYLPKKFKNLVNLIRLELTPLDQCSQPRSIGKLINLQTLFAFSVNNIKGYHISELKNMNALKGSIKIMKLENIRDGEEARDANLHQKSGLESLELEWTKSEISMIEPSVAEDILSKLQPHNNLVNLKVMHYNGKYFPPWMSSFECHLQSIYLHNCPNITELPPFWRLPFLRTLRLDSIDKLQHVGRQFYGYLDNDQRFACLECLEFLNMQQLESWCDELEIRDMPHIRELKFRNCPKLNQLPSLGNLSSLQVVEVSRCGMLMDDPELPMSASFHFTN